MTKVIPSAKKFNSLKVFSSPFTANSTTGPHWNRLIFNPAIIAGYTPSASELSYFCTANAAILMFNGTGCENTHGILLSEKIISESNYPQKIKSRKFSVIGISLTVISPLNFFVKIGFLDGVVFAVFDNVGNMDYRHFISGGKGFNFFSVSHGTVRICELAQNTEWA